VSDPLETPDFDLDEDLFDFAKVTVDPDDGAEATDEELADVLASFRAQETEEAAAFEASGPEPDQPEPEPEPRPAAGAAAPAPPVPRSAPAAPRTAPTPAPRATIPAPPAAPAPASVVPAARPARISRGLVAIALSMTVLNSLLAIVFLQRLPGSHEEVRADTPTVSEVEHGSAPETTPVEHEAETSALPDPDLASRVHGHPVLDQAREELARGDYAACRQHAYALLSVIDRFDDPRREEIEAECQYLIAQALHLEALARLGRNE
jgi:hypothetical protein